MISFWKLEGFKQLPHWLGGASDFSRHGDNFARIWWRTYGTIDPETDEDWPREEAPVSNVLNTVPSIKLDQKLSLMTKTLSSSAGSERDKSNDRFVDIGAASDLPSALEQVGEHLPAI